MGDLSTHGVVVVVKRGKRILLLKDSRDLMLGRWAPPHGRCETTDATEEDAVIRETLEETELRVKPLRKLWTTKADTKVKTVSFWEVIVKKGKIVLDKTESSEYGWFSISEALSLELYPGTRKFFQLVERGEISF